MNISDDEFDKACSIIDSEGSEGLIKYYSKNGRPNIQWNTKYEIPITYLYPSEDQDLYIHNKETLNGEYKYKNSKTNNSYYVFDKEVATGDPYYIFDRVDEIMSVEPNGDSTKDLIEFSGLLLKSLDNTYSEFLTLVAENDSVKNKYLNEFKNARESFAKDNQTEKTGSSGTLNYLSDEIFFTLNDLSRNVEIQTGGPLDLDKYGVEKFDTSKYVKANIPYFDFSNDEEFEEENNSNQESPYVKGQQLIVTGEKANIRQEPSLEAKVVGYWIKEDEVTVYGYVFSEDRWWIKTDPNKEWWVSERNLEIID